MGRSLALLVSLWKALAGIGTMMSTAVQMQPCRGLQALAVCSRRLPGLSLGPSLVPGSVLVPNPIDCVVDVLRGPFGLVARVLWGGDDRSTQLDRSPTYQSSLLPGLATKWDSAVPPSLLGLGCFVVASGGKSSAAASGRLVNGCEGTGAASTPCTCCYAVITLLGCARWCWSPPR